MKRMRLLSWIIYNTCFDIRHPDGSFLVPRAVLYRTWHP